MLKPSDREWSDYDYDVLADGVVVGRIMKAAAKPADASWLWTLAYGYHEDRTPTHGYEASREAAIDCHVHFIDAGRFRYSVFPRSAGFEALVGDYSALPRRYLPEDYRADAGGLHIGQTVWAEFMSDTPLESCGGRNLWRMRLAIRLG
jgi:hypothetical protein